MVASYRRGPIWTARYQLGLGKFCYDPSGLSARLLCQRLSEEGGFRRRLRGELQRQRKAVPKGVLRRSILPTGVSGRCSFWHWRGLAQFASGSHVCLFSVRYSYGPLLCSPGSIETGGGGRPSEDQAPLETLRLALCGRLEFVESPEGLTSLHRFSQN